MRQKLLLSVPMLVLMTASVLALSVGAYSLRGSGGDIQYIGSDNSFNYEKVSFSAYLTENDGQGSLVLQAKTTAGERIRQGIKLDNPVVLQDTASVLKVQNDAYFYQRVRVWGFWRLQKVEGTATYTYNKNTGETSVVGSNGLSFKVTGIQTINLK